MNGWWGVCVLQSPAGVFTHGEHEPSELSLEKRSREQRLKFKWTCLGTGTARPAPAAPRPQSEIFVHNTQVCEPDSSLEYKSITCALEPFFFFLSLRALTSVPHAAVCCCCGFLAKGTAPADGRCAALGVRSGRYLGISIQPTAPNTFLAAERQGRKPELGWMVQIKGGYGAVRCQCQMVLTTHFTWLVGLLPGKQRFKSRFKARFFIMV